MTDVLPGSGARKEAMERRGQPDATPPVSTDTWYFILACL